MCVSRGALALCMSKCVWCGPCTCWIQQPRAHNECTNQAASPACLLLCVPLPVVPPQHPYTPDTPLLPQRLSLEQQHWRSLVDDDLVVLVVWLVVQLYLFDAACSCRAFVKNRTCCCGWACQVSAAESVATCACGCCRECGGRSSLLLSGSLVSV